MNTLAEQWMKEGEQRILQKKDQWISEAKIANTQDLLIEQLEDELDIPSQRIKGQVFCT